jgi:NTE family protein
MTTSTPSSAKCPRTALVLAGGGARGAYQVGVLGGLQELGLLAPSTSGLDVFVGSSAGAINSTMLAAHAADLGAGIETLEDLWRNVRAQDVFRTDVRSIGSTGARWAWDLTFGGAVGGVAPKALLDTSPLREFLPEHIPFEQLDSQIEQGALHALAIAATDLSNADGVLFVHGNPDISMWERRRWRIERAHIGTEHVMASSSIPIFFPPIEVDGRYFGDGSVRNTAPLSPAINLGADRIIAVSVREPTHVSARARRAEAPSIAEIAGVLLDAVMLDAIEVDIDHSERINRGVVEYHRGSDSGPFRHVNVLWIQPSQDFTALAAEFSHRIPAVMRYVMRGLGSEEAMTELTSYLLFDPEFCARLIEVGRADVEAARPSIEAFFGA